jgi:hypothetical protein
MITLTREEAQQVLNALEAEHRWLESLNTGKTIRAIEILRARLAQPEPEPTKLLLIPALMEQAGWVRKKDWVGLTDEEKVEIQALKWWDWEDTFDLDGYTRAIEAKLKEKNA